MSRKRDVAAFSPFLPRYCPLCRPLQNQFITAGDVCALSTVMVTVCNTTLCLALCLHGSGTDTHCCGNAAAAPTQTALLAFI